jgi:integral membrane protein (TIGR01906 family)
MKVVKGITWGLFPVVVIMLMTLFMAGFQGFYTYEYEKNDIYNVTGISQNDMPEVIDRLSGYVVGRYKELNHEVLIHEKMEWIYGDREIAHMKDVRLIFDFLKYFIFVYTILCMITFISEYRKKKLASFFVTLSKFGLYGGILIVAIAGILVTVDFSKYFVVFHELVFSNDLWLLDPRTDVLIQMLPESFFMEMAVMILALSFAFNLIFFVVSGQMKRVVIERKRK